MSKKVVETPREDSNLPKQINCAVEPTYHKMLVKLQEELALPTLAATLQTVLAYYWTRGPIGHPKLP
jgi:hypothetical protein